MESTPLFSVLCVCWNEGAFLAEGIRSVLRQSEPSLELILVDDQSTDTTWEIMSAAAKEDPRVVILRNPTKGKVAGFNAAVALSKGQWIHLLGGDDMLKVVRDEFFPFMRTNLQQHPLGRYLKDANCLIPSGNLLSRAVAAIEELPLTEGDA